MTQGSFSSTKKEHPCYFWPLLNAKIAASYDIEVIDTVHSSADAAGWCANNGLDVITTATSATHHLDRYHINREFRRAFGGRTGKADHFINLAYRKKTKKMMRDVQLVINHAKGKDKKRYLDLQIYLANNLALIKLGKGPSMGTREGSNAHVYAARTESMGRGLYGSSESADRKWRRPCCF